MSNGNSVVFNGAEIRYNDTRRDEGGVFNRIHIAFRPSEPVIQAMGWDQFPDNIPSGKLSGRLAGTHLILTPTDKGLKKHEMQFGVNEIRDFSFTSETNDDGDIISRTVRCTVVTGEKIASSIEHWLSVVGEASAVAKIGYTVQQKLPGAELVDSKDKVKEMREQQETLDAMDEAIHEEQNLGLNEVNAMGSGREKKKRTRGEMSQADATEAVERAALASQLEGQLQ